MAEESRGDNFGGGEIEVARKWSEIGHWAKERNYAEITEGKA
jgi:hypothetical protein